ncbi:MAG: FkbM family methyltransferase [Candidatus Pacebacteria bacterium]|nr:FkbM family methyltransferase [Candidatus Paceibacterota bacterium]
MFFKSLKLDYLFWQVCPWPGFLKFDFLTKKYFLLIRHFLKPFELGKAWAKVAGDKIYYDSRLGLASYQSLLTRHRKMLNLAKIDTPIQTVIDIGANVGFFAKLMRERYPRCLIYCFEPVPLTFETLKKNFPDDSRIKLLPLAMSSQRGMARMRADSQDSATNSICSKGSVQVRTETLDKFVKKEKIKTIDILKIDTETSEALVLRGAQKSLAITKYLFLEVTIADNPRYTISSLFKLLSSSRFDFQLVAFRNYADTSERRMPIMDTLLKNTRLV